MPARILLVNVGLRENDHISGNRGIISDNVRWSAFFIQIFEDEWGPRDLFRKLFLLAVECRDDASMPMRDVVVCLKDAPNETNPEVLAFRKELEDRKDLRVIRYRQTEELRDLLVDICNDWTRALIDSDSHLPMVIGT
jgi:hypothetical protein